MDIWNATGALATVVTAIIAAVAAWQSRSAARQANTATATMTQIEHARRHSELSPEFRVSCEPLNNNSDVLTLKLKLLGPPGLDRIDRLTVSVRDDHFLRGESTPLTGSPTQEQVRQQIWGPYSFTPFTGPDNARSDSSGRVTIYDAILPLGEELPFQLERTLPPSWTHLTRQQWQGDRGNLVRLSLNAEHRQYGQWTLPIEIDT